MKQNQSLFRPFPGETTSVKPYDLISVGAACSCSRCSLIRDRIAPQIQLDEDLRLLKENNPSPQAKCDMVSFLTKLQESGIQLPRFRFLDTVVLQDGQPLYAIYFQDGKAKTYIFPGGTKLQRQTAVKSWLIERKEQLDLRYQIKKYQRENPSFHFTAFEHESEKRIKQFENNIKYKFPPSLAKTAIIKLKGVPQEKLLSKSEFEGLFSLTKQRPCELADIEYMQVFPLMYGEEDSSYPQTIKYFRSRQASRKGFRLAQCNVSTWRERNDSLQKLEEQVYQEIAKAELTEVCQGSRLQYMTYKLLIYFQEVSNMRIEEALVHYITNDSGRSFYFKKIECIRFEKRIPIDDIGVELPNKREYPPEDHISLKEEMKKLFQGFQGQFERLDKEREEMEEKVRKDRDFSNYVYKTITQKSGGENLHKILQSNNLKYKKEQLKL